MKRKLVFISILTVAVILSGTALSKNKQRPEAHKDCASCSCCRPGADKCCCLHVDRCTCNPTDECYVPTK